MLTDDRLVYAINGIIKFPAARELARQHRIEDLFPNPAYRWVAGAAMLAINGLSPVGSAPPKYRPLVRAIIKYLERTQIPDDEAWAIHLVRTLIEDYEWRRNSKPDRCQRFLAAAEKMEGA